MLGLEIHNLAKRLWKIDRSITGEGVRKTLNIFKEQINNLEIKQVETGTRVFDWKVPKEWKVNEAYIITPQGEKICDFSKNNLHLVGYSIPFRGVLSLEELNIYLHSLPNQANAIPYVTSYYEERWGFCISQNQRDSLIDGNYEVVIDCELFEGNLDYGELLIEGETNHEIFLSTYICHPSMANNELSGPTVLTFIAKWLQQRTNNYYSYRFVFIPETIGSIAYISLNHEVMQKHIIAGFNISCIGDDRAYSFLPSRNGNTLSDRVAKHVLSHIDPNFLNYKWKDRGSDERQYCSPGVDLPIASIMRTKYGQYPEYHTSLDNLENVVTPSGLDGGYWAVRKAIELLELNKVYQSIFLCEPQMGKRGLYPTLSTKERDAKVKLTMDFLSYCDGFKDILEIADKLEVPAWSLYGIVSDLVKNNLIKETKN